MKIIKSALIVSVLIAIVCVLSANAQVPENGVSVQLSYEFSGAYTLTERSDWAQYINGVYSGLTSRETRGYMHPEKTAENGTKYVGYFYILENTLRNNVKAARGLDEIRDTVFIIRHDGSIRFEKDNQYPLLRNFPAFPAAAVKPGDRWQAEGERVVDPKNNKRFTYLPITAEYEFIGKEDYKGKPVYRIKAKFATRLNSHNRPHVADDELKTAAGTHDVTILADAETCAVIMMIDRLDETFSYADGSSVRFKGTTSWFTEMPVFVESGELYRRAVAAAEKAAEVSAVLPSVSAFEIENTQQGVRLSVRNIRFKADSAQILNEDSWRLDAIADMLRIEPAGSFLVEGHTASVGNPDGEKKLSIDRAKAVIEELVKRGLREEQFLFAGYGGTQPVAGNDTAEGRAENRRVEITILQ